MIPNITRGGDPAGLLRYLVGRGRREEHVRPHLVAGSGLAVAVHGQDELSRAEAVVLAGWLDAPRREHGVEVRTRATTVDPESGDRVDLGWKRADVWHCSLSLPPGEGPLGNERWGRIATEFATAMGLAEAADGPGCRWVAVHHGPSAGGNDHVHLVASLVREDGTRWNPWQERRRAQQACRALEQTHGLTVVDGPARGVTERGIKPAEAERAERSGAVLTEPHDLAQRLRAAALASASEAEFVRRARADGVVIKPRYASGGTSEVVGYKAALVPTKGEAWVFHAGGKLARDLSLPRLRETWAAPTADDTTAAVAEWQATRSGAHPADREGRETRHLHPDATKVAAERIASFNERIAALDVTDTAGRADAARELAGALSALARDRRDAELQRAAREVARHAAQRRTPEQAGTRPRPTLGPAALVLLQTPSGQRTAAATRLITDQLLRAVITLHTQQRGEGLAAEAQRLRTRAAVPLQRAAEADRLASAPTGPGARPVPEAPPRITRTPPGREDRGR